MQTAKTSDWKDAQAESSRLPRSGKKVWKMKIFPGQGKVREVWFESWKLAKIGKSQGKVGNFKILSKLRCLWQSS